MQFADYLVSYSLQTLSRCLQKVSAAAGSCDAIPLNRHEEQLIVERIERLQSVWRLLQWSTGKATYRSAFSRLHEARLLLWQPPLETQAATQLLASSDPRTRPLIERITQEMVSELEERRNLPTEQRWSRLNWLLQEESACWRNVAALRQIPDSELLQYGLGRAYAKSRRLNRRLEPAGDDSGGPPGLKRIARARCWAGHVARHLEVLGPALSDAAGARCWHFKRLESKLEQQLALELFSRRTVETKLKPKARGRLDKAVGLLRRHIEKQRRKLADGAFTATRGEIVRDGAAAVAQLALQEITLLPVVSVQNKQNPIQRSN